MMPRCACGAHWRGLSRAHCSGCHVTFNAVSPFDRHRVGGACVAPGELGMVEREGVWSLPGSDRPWWDASPA